MSLPPRRRAAVPVSGLSGLVMIGASAIFVLAVAACETPPVGWEGAGQMQSLPSPQPDSGGAMSFDSGGDAPATGHKDSGGDSGHHDSGTEADSGKDTGSPVDGTTPKDAAAKDSAAKDGAGPDDAAGTDACTSNCG